LPHAKGMRVQQRIRENMPLFDPYWIQALRGLLPWATPLFTAISALGNDYFYVALIATGYWTMDKQSSARSALLLLASSVTNYWLKITLRNPRPHPTYWLLGTTATNYSLPSGHAQSSATIYGWLGIKNQDARKRALLVLLILLIGLSRIYIGVHWPGDILLGWAVGAAILTLAWKMEEPAASTLSKYNPDTLYLGLAAFGFAALILTEFFSPVNIPGLEDNFGANGGLIIGLGAGLALERKYVNFTTPEPGDKRRVILRVILGLSLVLLTMLVLSPILPTDIYWLRATRYALTAIVVLFLWPLIFMKLNI